MFDRDRIIAPDDVRGGRDSLSEAVALEGWPTLGSSRGKVLLTLLDRGPSADLYRSGESALKGRLFFTHADPGARDAAIVRFDDPIADAEAIARALAAGYLVGTRSDDDDTPDGDTSMRDAALSSGAQDVSTHVNVDVGRGFVVRLPGNAVVRCSPVTRSDLCVDSELVEGSKPPSLCNARCRSQRVGATGTDAGRLVDSEVSFDETGSVIIDCAGYLDGHRFEVHPDRDVLCRWETDSLPEQIVDDGDGPSGRAFVWLGLRVPDEHELQDACTALRFDDVSPSEILTPHERPVLTVDGPTVQLVLRTARYDDTEETVALGEMTLLVGPNSIISIRHGQASELASVRSALEHDPDRLRLGPMGVLTAVIGRVVGDYGPALDGFEHDVVEAELEVFTDLHRQPVERLYRLKREVRRTLVAFDALQDPLNRLIRALNRKIPDELIDDLNEAADQLDRAVTRATSLSGLLDAALTASLTQISVQQNNDMRKISAWVAMAAVPTMIAGIYGMNFESMPELDARFGYPVVLAVMAATLVVLYRFFKRSGWL